MTLTTKELGTILQSELDKGYDIVRISRAAFQLYQDHGVELNSDLNEKLLQLMAMEEGPEFEYSEEELRKLANDLAENLVE